MIPDFLQVLGSEGAKTIYYSDNVEGKSGHFKIDEITPVEISELSLYPITLMDENRDFAFTSSWDSFFTVFIAQGNAKQE